MNKSVKMILAGMAIAALSASVYAHSDDGCDFRDRGPRAMNPERMEKLRERHLGTLHDSLKLTSQQETAWKKYAAQPPVFDAADRPDPAELDKLNAPQRLEKGIERLQAMEKRLTAHLAALKEFYAVLTPEQQKIFDQDVDRFGDRWHHRR